MSRFADRRDAGRRLAEAVAGRFAADASVSAVPGPDVSGPDVVVLGLPRGGVPVADEVAHALAAPLDVLVVRKLGVPHRPEVAMGAVGEGGTVVWNDDVLAQARVPHGELRRIEARERAEVESRVARFRSGRAAAPIEGRTAVIVDDGVATGATARVACRVARAMGAARVVLAVPVAAPDSLADLVGDGTADEVVRLAAPPGFMAVGMHYLDFAQTPDAEVVAILADADSRVRGGG
ncbi:phosphoribosyltransferase [Agromyces protaetiae]|uniref:Phosphoribosyltransferase n=1 Tax=Agromyces protaetiae TaxID=2509455 RepID=A0A4P6FCK6_9MICO|nr:phosphoribosyltransferase family protein [Agromyces protaetiae]QAY73545.1 phosphoribosyltransferase [Agromyces protaetiae]